MLTYSRETNIFYREGVYTHECHSDGRLLLLLKLVSAVLGLMGNKLRPH